MSFKISDGKLHLLEDAGLNRMAIGGGLVSATEGAIGGAIAAGNSFWNEDYTGYQQTAAGASQVFSGAMDIGVGAAFGYASWEKGRTLTEIASLKANGMHAFEDVYKSGSSVTAVAGKQGKVLAGVAEWETIKQAEKGTRGFWVQSAKEGLAPLRGKGMFLKEGNDFSRMMLGGWKMPTALIAGTMLATAAFEKISSVAGQLMDESHLAFNQAKMHTYDNRQFNNRGMQTWGMQNQQAAMQAVGGFEQNMMSVARVYHSRG